MSEVDRIYQKYIGVFYEVDGGGTWIDLSAVRYALRAALRELAGPPNPDRQGSPARDQHQYEVLAKQIERLNDWLFEHAPALAHDPYTDTADAMIAAADRLRGTVERLRIELAAAIDERNVADVAAGTLEREIAGLREQLAAVDADNARLAQELRTVRSYVVATPHSNGDITDDFGAVITAPGKTRTVPEMLALVDAANVNAKPGLVWPGELADWVEGLERGRHDWRKLAKSVRWQLIANVVQQIPADESALTVWFDTHRPGWMSTARAAALTFGEGSWTRVVHMALAGEVPA